MDQPTQISCQVTSDLMVVYATDRASAETRQLVDAHLRSCPACTYAFRNEPSIRAGLDLPAVRPDRNFSNSLAQAGHYGLVAWGAVLYALSRCLDLLGRLLRRIGIPTASLKIRTFRARRKVAGAILGQTPAASFSSGGSHG